MGLKIIFNGNAVARDDLSGVDPTCGWRVTCSSISISSTPGRLKQSEQFEGGLDNLTQALNYADSHSAEFPSDELTLSNLPKAPPQSA